MKPILISTVILLLCSPSPAQQTRHATSSDVFEGGPQSCLRFAEMADRADAVSILQDITEDEFMQAYKASNKIVRNPGQVFDIGNIHYLRTETNGKPSFDKITTREDKKHEFLHWYSAEGGDEKMFFAGNKCFWDLSNEVMESKEPRHQQALQMECSQILSELNLANSIAKGAADEMIQGGFQLVNTEILEIERLKDRYNKLVENLNDYNKAVNEYIDITNRVFATNRMSPPTITPTPVRVQPITCTGNTLALGQATSYANSTDMIVSGTTTVHCE